MSSNRPPVAAALNDTLFLEQENYLALTIATADEVIEGRVQCRLVTQVGHPDLQGKLTKSGTRIASHVTSLTPVLKGAPATRWLLRPLSRRPLRSPFAQESIHALREIRRVCELAGRFQLERHSILKSHSTTQCRRTPDSRQSGCRLRC
jgi:hypothetical protein